MNKIKYLKYILVVFVVFSALLTSFLPVSAAGPKRPTVTKPSIGQNANKEVATDTQFNIQEIMESEENVAEENKSSTAETNGLTSEVFSSAFSIIKHFLPLIAILALMSGFGTIVRLLTN